MKRRFCLVILTVMLLTIVLACGSESDVEVKQPESSPEELTKSEEITSTESQLGTSRDNPAPTGSEIVADDMSFLVSGVTRPATDIIMEGNQFNTEPEVEQEYILVDLKATCKKSPSEKCSLSIFNLKVVGSSGVTQDAEWMVAGVDGLLEDADFYGDASLEGAIPFIVGTAETNLLLVYEPFLGDTFYLELP